MRHLQASPIPRFSPVRHRHHENETSSKTPLSSTSVLGLLLLASGCFDPGVPPPDALTSSDGGSSDTGTGADTAADVGTGTEPECGNGIVEDGELCDDAGPSATCNADCTPVRCGDGVINLAGEQCDDGTESAFCDADCTAQVCGDGVVNTTAAEQCDDGGESSSCNVNCTTTQCGDGIFNASAGEECDDAGRTGACNVDCTLAECGDGYVNAMAAEECDDAGESATCNADCSPAVCGDGVTNATAGEGCDDAGISANCDVDCTPAECGDAFVNAVAGEVCDGVDLAGGTCQGLGYSAGVLACGDGCAYATNDCTPGTPLLNLALSQVKHFDFSWPAALGADYYQLFESASPGDPYVQVGANIAGTSTTIQVPLHFRFDASYLLRACNVAGCTDSAAVDVVGSLAEAVGYFKASNTGGSDGFGYSVALSTDGSTLAVGAIGEDSGATGIGGNQADNGAVDAGAVYVFVRSPLGVWSQQAYVKASNAGAGDNFGRSVSISANGDTLVVGAYGEDSNATGIGGNQGDNGSADAGAVYVFVRNGIGVWSQQAYIKASNTNTDDRFGWSVASSANGDTLAVGAYREDSNATGVGGNHSDNSASYAGAAYVFVRNGMGVWSQQAYVKASNTESGDRFGYSLALSGDGMTLAVVAIWEASGATGIGGNQADNSSGHAGAAYVFVRNGLGIWSTQAYVKASNTGLNDGFGQSLTLSNDGNTLAVGAPGEDSNATGIGGDAANNSAADAGAAYIFVRNGLGAWSQQAYAKASNTGGGDQFGGSMALSPEGDTLVVGAFGEDGNATGIGGDGANNTSVDAGAAYVLVRDGLGAWSQRAYVKASNTGAGDQFGTAVAVSSGGDTLAFGVNGEDSNATGISGNQVSNTAGGAGAIYVD